jgi:hypothetical protein
MMEGLFQPMHLIVGLMVAAAPLAALYAIVRVVKRAWSK